MTIANRTDITPRELRDTLGHYASGVTIITGHDSDGPIGFTCQSFYSVSMEPPLVSFSVMTTSTTYPRIRRTGTFGVNVLAHSQHELSNQFARKGTDKWSGVQYSPSPSGNPLIEGTQMWVDCELREEYVAGDHVIVVGEVVALSPADWHLGEPLLFFRGTYRRLNDHIG
ncbi:flavin reductase [Subtercola boreus]|uniref:Flavin reductase n=1 Tax=Subtercola boreus TaxID=120213 RepID=A0A3E0VGQ3_9MICO|nr:flavin reductase family protein [Subtercola boreus]RFA08839.1 flavin reductase [Subtercola boreus]TQL54189.1 flavin reductase (DIM6/NTAB) family NADH-FMN oxidoreductase RutF [Subtercola boreus]